MACTQEFTQTVTMKVGAEFRFASQFTDEDTGTPQDLTGYTIASEVDRMDGTLVETLTANWLDASIGTFELFSTSTAGWPSGTLQFDVKLTSPTGAVVYSDTFGIVATASVTS